MSKDELAHRRQERAARNQALWREVNERIEELNEQAAFTEFKCECALDGCSGVVSLSVDEYEEIRKTPTYFFVADRHVVPEVERIVRATLRYTVVEKIGVGARVAKNLDPRSKPTADAILNRGHGVAIRSGSGLLVDEV
jgi:hypothetical protein